jgi:chorismate mutase
MVEAEIEVPVDKEVEKEEDSKILWEQTIARINELNDLILEALKKRSKFPIARSYFDINLRRHEEGNPQKELESKGLDTIGWHSTYSKIVEKICPEGDYVEGVVEAEAKLEELVDERIYIGKKVIDYKAPRGKPIERKEREKQIYAYVRDYASKNGMDPDAVEEVFKIIIEKNRTNKNKIKNRRRKACRKRWRNLSCYC